MKLQKNLEKEFAKRYKKTDFSQSEGDTAYSLGKHYGDLGKGNDTYYGHMYDSRRSTGHFGTGTYFVGEDYQPGEHSSYANRPVQKVEFDDYNNLFKPANRDAGFDLHDGLKEVNYNNTPISKELYDKLLPYYEASFNSYNGVLDEDYENDYKNVRNLLEEAGVETEEPQNYYDSGKGQYGKTYEKYLEDEITEVLNNYDRYQKAERDLKRVLGITDEQFNEAIEKVRQTEKEYEKHSYDQKLKDDSLSTVFMKTLGYNGVDVRGLEGLDDTTYGSVIYDLDNKTNNISYSLTSTKDSQGRELSKQQQEYFKDSKVVDDNGNLKVVYRGSSTEKSYNVFDTDRAGSNGIWFGKGFYFAGELDHALTYAKNNDTSNIYEVYLNLTNPYIMDSDTTNPDGTIEFAPGFYEQIENKFGDYLPTDWKELNSYQKGRAAQNALMDNGYDGVIAGDTYVAYNSNQIKNVDNTNPTSNEDIRYSLITNKDSNGKTLTKEQQNYFKDTKIVDNKGNLLEVYRGEPTTGKTTYEMRKGGGNKETNEYGIYFTNSKDFAKDFSFERIEVPNDIFFVKKGKEGEVKSAYLNITNPLDLGTITEEEIRNLYPYASSMAKQITDEEKFVSDMLNWQQIGNHQLMKSYLDMKEVADNTDYDGLVAKLNVQGNELEYAVFNSNQIKSTDNTNPTLSDDIRESLTSNQNIDSKEIAPVGSTVEETIAPIREDLSKIAEQMDNLSNQVETLQNELETKPESTPKGYVETFNEQRNENIPTRATTEEEANTLQDALMQDEGYLRSLEEQANQTEENTKLIDRLTNNITERLDLERSQKQTLRGIIKESIDNGYTADEISQALQKEFSEQSYEMTNQEAVEARKLIREIPINVSDAVKMDITDYGDFKRSNFGKINFSRNGTPVDVAYGELNEQMPYFFPSDIINPSDQLQKIAEVANMATKTTETFDIDSDEFDNIADYIKNTVLEDEYNAQMNADMDLEKTIQFNMNEDVLPTTIRTQESIDDYIENRDIAPVRQDMTNRTSKSTLREKLDNMRRTLGQMIVNRNYVIDETSKATGNKEIKFAGDMLNSVSGEAQYNINNKQTDMNGNTTGKSVTEIFAPSKKAGLYEVFNDYLFNKSNIERHQVGKGSQVPLAVSQQLVNQYEAQYPQLKEWAKDVYKYYDNVLQDQVDAGLITQEKYNDYRGEHGIYRSYTPFYADSIDTNRYFDNEGKIKPVSTLKRSKGNATDVNQLLSMEDAMAKQTYAYKRAIRQNELYKQIVTSLDKYSDAMDIDIRDNPTNLQDTLYITPDGDKVLSAYVDGEKMSAKIGDELYNELMQENENRIKKLEEDFSLISKPLQKVSNVRRNILTTWNPTFLARNAIKDIQDAVINSKHTGDMLKNYFGLKKGQKSAVFELREGKTQEAQQFLALYGADNLYGDYSKVDKSKNPINKFSRANELIELAPRFAEFKASLQNGESVSEAIYNAREVTTNFGRGGYITKALNRNGFTFLNANVQGLDKVVRNLSGQNGVKGVTSVVVKGIAFAMLPSILNELLYGFGDDKDEEYEALPDYIKDNYYLIKTEGNQFVRIPKGRINAAFGSLARRTINAIEGQDDPYEGWGKNAWDQIGVGDLGSNNILAPIIQAKNNEAWYGGDIVPSRLQNKPAAEQTDAKIDAISNTIGELFNVSPYKVHYVLDQYSGGIGDVFLPMITPETTSGAENPIEYLTAPIKDSFIVNSTDDNKYAGEFYDLKDKLQIQSNSDKATDEDVLKYKYMSSISKQMSDLYKEKREVQADTTIGNKEKYQKVQIIQNEINNLAKEALSNYQNVNSTDTYSNVGNEEYYKDAENEWKKVNDSDSEFTAGLTPTEKNAYYTAKDKITNITQDYTKKTKDLKKDDPLKKQYSAERKEQITNAIVNSGLDDYTKAMLYSKYYSDKDKMTNVVNAGYNVDTYITALNDIEVIRDKYSQKNGYSTEYRKKKTIAYINSLDMEIPQKAMLIRNYYSSFRTYNNDIVNFVSNLDISYEEKVEILKDTGMTVNGNNVSWK